MISLVIKKIFGTKNARELKKLQPLVGRVGELEPKLKALSDADLAAWTPEFRRRLDRGQPLDELLPEAFAVCREAGRRILEMRHFDVQLIGGAVLHRGTIAEMRTGEGKTLVATLPAYLNALTGKGVHVVTVNDYLARRDAEWMGKIYKFLGLTVGTVLSVDRDDQSKQAAYRADITYGQNNEYGFDYLRDNMKLSPDRMVQRELNFAIVNEVDSILIDEARTPLIISGPAEESADLYAKVNQIIPRLKKEVEFTVDEKAHSAMLTDQGVERVEKLLGIANLYDSKNIEFNHHVTQALRAHTLYKRDVNYLVDDAKVIIIDEHTGRKMPGRRWSDGLHQAIEAKENVTIEEENQTLATITFQNFFRMYKKLAGMTGTAETEAEELHKIYKLEVCVIPTNKPMIRDDRSDLVYKNEKGKFRAVMAELEECHAKSQPVLVGTVSVEKSEVLSQLLKKKNIAHHVLNAKFHEMEATIVAQAGRKGSITIATNMAGRGTDIVLGGNPDFLARQEADPETAPEQYHQALEKFRVQCAAERDEVLKAGGLHILGTERHESRRIDNQLRGRGGRQGDPGSSRFYLSLEDDLLRVFGAERITGIMERLGMEEDVPIEHPWVNRAIENAQRKVEGHHFDSRKNLLEYDDVMNQQRKTIYALRRQVLEGRYAPEPTEEQRKQGITATEAPKVSGDWTVETLKEKLTPQVGEFLERFFAPAAETAPGDGPMRVPAPPAPVRTWRQLRHEVWRQFGALVDVEKPFEAAKDGDRAQLLARIVETVSTSLIQQRERIYDLADQLIGRHVDESCPSNLHSDEWNFDQLAANLQETFNHKYSIDRTVQDPQEIAKSLWEQTEALLKQREEELTGPFFLYFARHFWLEEIDQQWIDHLKAMEHLREGVWLRGYGQKDPKQAYKKEGFELFGEMMDAIARNVAQKLYRVQIVRDEKDVPELKQKQRKMVASHPASAPEGGEGAKGGEGVPAEPQKPVTVRRAEPKVGRNDPCPCGSGKKYKKCHGTMAALIIPGFRFAGVAARIKKNGKPDVALLVADAPVAAAGVFTRNKVVAAPVVLSKERVRAGRARAIVVNSGNANACTGAQGERDARAMTSTLARAIGAADKEVLVASTGVIGQPLPMPRVTAGIDDAAAALSPDGFDRFAGAICTTDKSPKVHVVQTRLGRRDITVAGCAKGAGMIAPDMATTLAFLVTDAAARPAWLRRVLREEADRTFNRVLVDGDTSTNDSVFLLAGGQDAPVADDRAGRNLRAAVHEVLDVLSRMLVADGEGAQHVVTIDIQGARSEKDARTVARRIATSPLVKTALFGADPNWGRIVAAAGATGVPLDPARLTVDLDAVPLVRGGVGVATPGTEQAAHEVMLRPAYTIRLHLHAGRASFAVTTCDLGHDYVSCNADYRS